MKSIFGKLNLNDILKSAARATIIAFMGAIFVFLKAGTFPTEWSDWKTILILSLTTFVGFILDALSQNSDGKHFRKEQKPELNA